MSDLWFAHLIRLFLHRMLQTGYNGFITDKTRNKHGPSVSVCTKNILHDENNADCSAPFLPHITFGNSVIHPSVFFPPMNTGASN